MVVGPAPAGGAPRTLGARVTRRRGQRGDSLIEILVVLLIIGIGGWLVVVQPWRHFDDINQPLDDGHGHGHATEQAIVPHDDSANAVETAQH